jgi:signal peptidase II
VTPRKKQILWIVIVFLVVVTVDQTTKTIVRTFCPVEKYLILGKDPQFFRISHQENPGVVGGVFRENRVMAHAAPLLATLVLLYLFSHLDMKSKIQSTAYGMIWGGAIGNLVDRLRLGVVTDFLQFHFYFIPFDFPWKLFPAFNVADSCICTGVFFLIVSWYWIGEKRVPNAA